MRSLLARRPSARVSISIAAITIAAGAGLWSLDCETCESQQTARKAEADSMLRGQLGCFVPNLGQWEHPARFVQRGGLMTMFVEEAGWLMDLREPSPVRKADPHDRHAAPAPEAENADETLRGVAVRMSFVGARDEPELVGERQLPGHYNYFLGADESGWRTEVPRYASVRARNLYPGIDVRLRQSDGHFEYDLLCETGADLASAVVQVEGADRMAIDDDGTLVIETAVGPIRQPKPSTWECLADGSRRAIECDYALLSSNRFGFAARWDGARPLVIDPPLIWSTFLGGGASDHARDAVVDASGVITVAGDTRSSNFPTSAGAYSRTIGAVYDAFVSRLDPRKKTSAQLLFSTFLGGPNYESAYAVATDAGGVVTVSGPTLSSSFPTTATAIDRTYNGSYDVFVSRFDPTKTGGAQLVYSTYLGGAGSDTATALQVDTIGITLTGSTDSAAFPTTAGAFDTTHNGGHDAFIVLLDPSKPTRSELRYSTFLGGGSFDVASALTMHAPGVVTVVGATTSANFPTTASAFDQTYHGGRDVFVARLVIGRVLLYSTYFGAGGDEAASAVDVDSPGVITLAGVFNQGMAWPPVFPTTRDAFDSTYNGDDDGFVVRLDPAKTANAQLLYSTLVGGRSSDIIRAVSTERSGVVTIAGGTRSADFPTTRGAVDESQNGSSDVFVSRLDPRRTPRAQLLYSTFLGSTGFEEASRSSPLETGGVVTVVGRTDSTAFPTVPGSYDTSHNGNRDAFLFRLRVDPLGTRRFGAPSAGCQGPPAIRALDDALVGSTVFGFGCERAPVGKGGAVLIGAGASNGTPILGTRVYVHLGLPLVAVSVTADAKGEHLQKLSLPAFAKGGRFFAQYVWLDASCSRQPLSASDALAVTVQ